MEINLLIDSVKIVTIGIIALGLFYFLIDRLTQIQIRFIDTYFPHTQDQSATTKEHDRDFSEDDEEEERRRIAAITAAIEVFRASKS